MYASYSQYIPVSEHILDISITFVGKRPNAVFQLKVIIAGTERGYKITKGKERTICQILNERMWAPFAISSIITHRYISPCNQTKEIMIKLFEYRYNVGALRKKEKISAISGGRRVVHRKGLSM